MKRKLNTSLGFYSPSFLRMHIGTHKSLVKLSTINDDLIESIYLHEYTHFIQDLTTTYGLSNICATVDYMKFANNHIIKLPKGVFSVPVQPIPNGVDNVHTNLSLFKIYNGTGEKDDVTLNSYQKLSKTVQSNKGVLNVSYIEVTYTTHSGHTDNFEFGALCIVESMAFIIESECYNNCPPSPDLPYLSAEKLVELIFPAFGQDRLNILALCDCSLKHVNPGIFFLDTLLRIRDDKISVKIPEDIYDICNQVEINHRGAKTLNDLFQILECDTINQLHGYFNDPNFQPLKDWLENMVKKAVKYRLQKETFPLEIARGGKLTNNRELGSFMTNVGTPLVTNDAAETTLVDPRFNANNIPNYSTIWAIDQIHSVFWGWQKNCELLGFCSAANIKIDLQCINEPWQRNMDPTCAFGQIWRHWGLTGYVPV